MGRGVEGRWRGGGGGRGVESGVGFGWLESVILTFVCVSSSVAVERLVLNYS